MTSVRWKHRRGCWRAGCTRCPPHPAPPSQTDQSSTPPATNQVIAEDIPASGTGPVKRSLIFADSFYHLQFHLCHICSLTSPSFVIITIVIHQAARLSHQLSNIFTAQRGCYWHFRPLELSAHSLCGFFASTKDQFWNSISSHPFLNVNNSMLFITSWT